MYYTHSFVASSVPESHTNVEMTNPNYDKIADRKPVRPPIYDVIPYKKPTIDCYAEVTIPKLEIKMTQNQAYSVL